MYNEDYVTYETQGASSEPLFMTKGVRQGCQSSPLLWNIYIKPVIDKEGLILLHIGIGIIRLFMAPFIYVITSSLYEYMLIQQLKLRNYSPTDPPTSLRQG